MGKYLLSQIERPDVLPKRSCRISSQCHPEMRMIRIVRSGAHAFAFTAQLR
jgi:hypothetical protein